MSSYDPYAPPQARADVVRKRRSGEPDFSSEARSVGLVVLLSIITLGIYPAIWFVRRQPFIDALDSDKKLGKAMAWAPLVTYAVVIVLGFAIPDDAGGGSADRALSGGAGAVSLMVGFRVAHILRSHLAWTGRLMDVSSMATFFFGVWYLQHVINGAASTPARIKGAKKRRKKKKAEPAPAEVDGADAEG